MPSASSPSPDIAIHLVPVSDPAAIARCHEVMRELRPHLADLGAFTEAVVRSQMVGSQFVYLEAGGLVRSVTSFRLCHNLAWGYHMYVDDLVTRAQDHGHGYGSALIDWLISEARDRGCAQFHLDSGVQRFDAHRFYLHKGMNITSHHFGLSF